MDQPKLLPNIIIFWISGFIFKLIKIDIPQEMGKHEKNLKFFEKKVSVSEKKNSAPIYRNWTLVSVVCMYTTLAATKNLGLGCNYRPRSAGNFLLMHPSSVGLLYHSTYLPIRSILMSILFHCRRPDVSLHSKADPQKGSINRSPK